MHKEQRRIDWGVGGDGRQNAFEKPTHALVPAFTDGIRTVGNGTHTRTRTHIKDDAWIALSYLKMERAQCRGPRYWPRSVCSRTLMVSSGCPTTMPATPATVPAIIWFIAKTRWVATPNWEQTTAQPHNVTLENTTEHEHTVSHCKVVLNSRLLQLSADMKHREMYFCHPKQA
jgi:hypothetical protein